MASLPNLYQSMLNTKAMAVYGTNFAESDPDAVFEIAKDELVGMGSGGAFGGVIGGVVNQTLVKVC